MSHVLIRDDEDLTQKKSNLIARDFRKHHSNNSSREKLQVQSLLKASVPTSAVDPEQTYHPGAPQKAHTRNCS